MLVAAPGTCAAQGHPPVGGGGEGRGRGGRGGEGRGGRGGEGRGGEKEKVLIAKLESTPSLPQADPLG